jgi:hypothetical protein
MWSSWCTFQQLNQTLSLIGQAGSSRQQSMVAEKTSKNFLAERSSKSLSLIISLRACLLI